MRWYCEYTASTKLYNLWAKLRMARAAVMSMARVIASMDNRKNNYIENLNLFTASMGEYTEQAKPRRASRDIMVSTPAMG